MALQNKVDVGWIYFVQYMKHRRALVNTECSGSIKRRTVFLPCLGDIPFSRMTAQ
jgi:hypothetical protein